MADKLSTFNGALRLCRERRLATLTDSVKARRLLDDAWGDGANGGAVKHCLEMGQWTWATRSGLIASAPSIEPSFGYRYGFTQPEDMVRVTGIYLDEDMTEPLLDYRDERQVWYAPIDPIYVSWVSNGDTYGADMSLWPESFGKLVEAYLANEIVFDLTADKEIRLYVEKQMKMAKRDAASMDAMRKPTAQLPTGSWVRARQGSSQRRYSRWNGQFT